MVTAAVRAAVTAAVAAVEVEVAATVAVIVECEQFFTFNGFLNTFLDKLMSSQANISWREIYWFVCGMLNLLT